MTYCDEYYEINDKIRMYLQWEETDEQLFLKLLQHPLVDLNYNYIHLLPEVSRQGLINIVGELLKNEKLDSSTLDDALFFACATIYDRVDIIRLLLSDNRVDPSYENNKFLMKTIENYYCTEKYEIGNHIERSCELLINDCRFRMENSIVERIIQFKENDIYEKSIMKGIDHILKILVNQPRFIWDEKAIKNNWMKYLL